MVHKQSATDIHVDVNIDSDQGAARFRYTPTEYVADNGDIDLTTLPRGTVNLCFRLQTPQVTLDDTTHKLGFAADESIWICEARHGNPTRPYRRKGILEHLRISRPQFHGYSSPGERLDELRLFNRNTSGKEYKYTLRVQATGSQGTRMLKHDPKIKNHRGAGQF